ncbi:uncharacterized protein [Macrobrachium rosenbergii]|uniref:uncharacterized protein n=1 Tax=Macrobrachium rosenbergii TaxID=79674 RepID=UPI0034D4EA18
MPRTPEEWKHVAEEFNTRWNFPNCHGAIDGKHILIRPPHGSGSYYYNYKGSHNIVLMAICDANSEFIYVDVGTNGHVSDRGVWDDSSMSTHIANGTAGLPCDEILPGSERSLPFVFVADDTFPLQRHIMKPFSHQQQNNRECLFSYRVSRARQTVENAFGILANRFCIFLTPRNLPMDKVEKVVLVCTSVHIILRRDKISKYMQPEGFLECEDLSQGTVSRGTWRATPDLIGLERVGWNPTNDSKYIRKQCMEFFSDEGAVAWQNKMYT